MTRLKFVIFDMGTPISAVLALVALGAVTIGPGIFSQGALPSIGVLLGLIYFLQKQKLEETGLFKDLFVEFNKRYDDMNEKLDAITRRDIHDPLSDAEKAIIIDYLNLCAEEYLFYRRGYIHPLAWETWRRGMKRLICNNRIFKFASEELKDNGYYGFSNRVFDA